MPIRPDLNYVSKDLARPLHSRASNNLATLKLSIRYPKGAEDYMLTMRPDKTNSSEATFNVTTYVGSDWASCCTTRRPTAGCTIAGAGVAIHHYSRTQSKSSGEAELDDFSSCATETMGGSCRSQGRAEPGRATEQQGTSSVDCVLV